jgi:hypothetical protein
VSVATAPVETAPAIGGVAAERVVMLFGLPRSGTTWLAKVFDSHPDVLYRHEPDTVWRGKHLPVWPPAAPPPALLAETRAYLERLLTTRTLKTMGSRPLFPKAYRGAVAERLRGALIEGLRVVEHLGGRRLAGGVPIPDWVAAAAWGRITLAFKSVSSPTRLGLFARALPGCRIIYTLRHPCGQVASMRRGERLGMFENELDFEWLLAGPEAKAHGLDVARFARWPLLERLAWQWLVLNERALADLAGHPAARIVRHADLARAPLARAGELLAFAGLSVPPETAAFIRRSTEHAGDTGYYRVFRNAAAESDKWRRELDADEQARIWAVVRHSHLAAFWPEMGEA